MAYQTIHTIYGLGRMAAAEATGVPINITHMAVGDGGGNDVEPIEGQTQLANEKYRATINRVYQVPDSQTRYAAEFVVPLTAGGFTMREIGVFDDVGGLFVVGNMPAVYIPTEGEGSFVDAVVRCYFEVSNAGIVTIMIDPNVAVASQQWVINNITGGAVIPGGLTGQVLSKQTNADGDFVWIGLGDIKALVDVIEEPQTLADSQTQVDLLTTTTQGLAVYIEGIRLRRGSGVNEWQENPASPFTSILLGQSYPGGTQILMAQNDPLGNVIESLEKSKNLADVPDKAAARANLEIFSKDETRQMAPPGEVSFFARSTTPAGWLKANGATVSRTAYADLFAAIGTTFGPGDGFSTFRLPDLRGEFIRGWDDGRGVDQFRSPGSSQAGMVESHSHDGSTGASGSHRHNITLRRDRSPIESGNAVFGDEIYFGTQVLQTDAAGTHSHSVNIASTGGVETRPRNVALLACIKY